MGRLTQRCAGQWCGHRVYGATSFRRRTVQEGRSPICRFCEGRDRANARWAHVSGTWPRRIAELRAEEHYLAMKLTKVRRKRYDIERRARLVLGTMDEPQCVA